MSAHNTIAFFGGMIKKDKSGDLSAVVLEKRLGNLGTIVDRTDSDVFRFMTSGQIYDGIPRRFYIGISAEAGDYISKETSRRASANFDFAALDGYFLNMYAVNSFTKLTEFALNLEKKDRINTSYSA